MKVNAKKNVVKKDPEVVVGMDKLGVGDVVKAMAAKDAGYRYGYPLIPAGEKFLVTSVIQGGVNNPAVSGVYVLPLKPTNSQATIAYYANPRQTFTRVAAPKSSVANYLATLKDPFLAAFKPVGYTIGTDPEVFAVDKDKKVIPAWKFLPDKPKSVVWSETSTSPRAIPHWDGFQGEFVVKPTHCLGYLTDFVHEGLKKVFAAASQFNPTAELTWETVLPADPEELQNAESKYVQLGCAPSVNIYEEFVPPVTEGRQVPFRFSGCHMHFGLSCGRVWTAEMIKRAITGADAIGAVLVTVMLNGMENPIRRHFYGRPGEYRVSKDRLEYRTISSAVLAHPALFHFAFDMVRMGLYMGHMGMMSKMFSVKKGEARDAVLNYDIPQCKKIVKRNAEFYKAILKKHYTGYNEADAGFMLDMVNTGFKNLVDVTPSKMAGYWKLGARADWRNHSEVPDGHFAYLAKRLWEEKERKKYKVQATTAYATY